MRLRKQKLMEEVRASVYLALATSFADGAVLGFSAVNYDPLGMWDNTQKYMVVPQKGIYRVKANLASNGNMAAGQFMGLFLMRSGNAARNLGRSGTVNSSSDPRPGSTVSIQCEKGDRLSVRIDHNVGGPWAIAPGSYTFFEVELERAL